MRKLIVVAVLALPAAAAAHFRFLLTDGGSIDYLVTNTTGDPINDAGIALGSQKTDPCDTGPFPSGAVTNLVAGQTYNVRFQETVFHPGHYRVALAQNRATFPTMVAVNTPTSCFSTAVESPVVAPVLVDGAKQHTTAFANPQNIPITVPNTVGNGY